MFDSSSVSGKDKNLSIEDQIDPYVSFLNHKVVVRPIKGRMFDAILVQITPNDFVFEGDSKQKSIYARTNVRSMMDRGEVGE
jgi:hypothetical protein